MSDKLFDLFYYTLPGAFFILNIIFFFQDEVNAMRNDFKAPSLDVVLLLVASMITGLLLEVISSLTIKHLRNKKKRSQRIHRINRILFYFGSRKLPEHYSGRAEFFRNLTLAFWILACVFPIANYSELSLCINILVPICYALTGIFTLFVYLVYVNIEVSILEGYATDLEKDSTYIIQK